MSRRLQQKPIAMTEEMIEAIDKYAAKHNTNFSNAVRLLIDSSLDTDAARANENMIRQYIREELDICIAPHLKKIEGIIYICKSLSAIYRIGGQTENCPP